MGIGGSGMSSVAQIAQSRGFEVTGCDIQTDTPYIEKVKSAGIRVFTGHDAAHLQNIDFLAVTPAVFYQNDGHPEVEKARLDGIIFKWQDFLGKYLHHGKKLICIAGTHGKSTTTSISGLLLEAADLDPTVEVGATVKNWHNNVRIGAGEYFISEADEFHDNFGSYESDIIILTMIEFDHPEFFKTTENMLTFYQKFIDHRKPEGKIIANFDSPLIHNLRLPPDTLFYSLTQCSKVKLDPISTEFTYDNHDYVLIAPGSHNISNSLAVINLAKLLHIDPGITSGVLKSYTGIGRRMELLGEKNGILVYDDYANHPSSFAATISAVKQAHPDQKIWAVIEPHTYSRLSSMLPEMPFALRGADEVIVSKIFASRESDPGNFTGADIVTAMDHPRAHYIPEFSDIITYLKVHSSPSDVILVMGSGNSYQLSRQILESL